MTPTNVTGPVAQRIFGRIPSFRLLLTRFKSSVGSYKLLPSRQRKSDTKSKHTSQLQFKVSKVDKKEARKLENSAQKHESHVLSILEKPQYNNIDLVVSKRIQSLKSCIKEGTDGLIHTENGLSWIMDHFGSSFWSDLNKDEQIFIRKVMDCQHATALQLFIRKTHNQKCLAVILEELIVRSELDERSLISIIMRLDLDHLISLHQRLSSNSCLVKHWDIDANVRIKCEITLAFRYKMLKSNMLCRYIIDQYLETEWLPCLKMNAFNSPIFLRNMVYLLKDVVKDRQITNLVLNYNIPSLTYCYWESNPEICDVRFSLISLCDQLNIFQQVIVKLINTSLISTDKKYIRKLCYISKDFKLSTEGELNYSSMIKFTSSIEVLLSKLKEDTNTETAEGMYLFTESIRIFENFKRRTCRNMEQTVCIPIGFIGDYSGTQGHQEV